MTNQERTAAATSGVDQESVRVPLTGSTASTTDAGESSGADATLRSGYSGSEWLARQMTSQPASALGGIVADILGEVFRGLYHLDKSALYHDRTQWHNERLVVVTLRNELATHDSTELTWLVLLAHAHGVRLSIRGASNNYVRLQFTRGENMYFGKVRTVAQVVGMFNERYPLHRFSAAPSGRAG